MFIEQLIVDNTAAVQSLTVAVQSLTAAIADLMQHPGGTAGALDPAGKPPTEEAIVAKAVEEFAPKAEKPVEAPVEKAAKATKEPKGDPVTYDDVKAATLALHKTVGRDAVVTLLATYGCDNATKLDKKQWPAYVADCKKAMP